jgi:hypothetical protein
MKRSVVVLSATLTVASFAARAAPITLLDDFSEVSAPAGFVQLTAPEPRSAETGLTTVAGGSRVINAQWDAAAFGAGDSITLFPGVFDGRDGLLSFSSGPGRANAMTLSYDGDGNGLGISLSADGYVSVGFDPDHIGFQKTNIFELTLTDTAANTANAVQILGADGYSRPDWTDVTFPMSDFVTAVNLSNIAALSLRYEGDVANDASFDYIAFSGAQTIPGGEPALPLPSTLWLLGIGLLGLLHRRRHRRRS